jgi:hypothetical protein
MGQRSMLGTTRKSQIWSGSVGTGRGVAPYRLGVGCGLVPEGVELCLILVLSCMAWCEKCTVVIRGFKDKNMAFDCKDYAK